MTSEEYGCVRKDGDVVSADGQLGLMRGDGFHPITEAGAAFHAVQNSPLAAHC